MPVCLILANFPLSTVMLLLLLLCSMFNDVNCKDDTRKGQPNLSYINACMYALCV